MLLLMWLLSNIKDEEDNGDDDHGDDDNGDDDHGDDGNDDVEWLWWW